MPSTPGRPHEPTIHPRTKPEANEYALKNRLTSDWFRQDGKNIEVPVPQAPRSGTSQLALAIAIKSRGDAATWFQHDPNAPPQPKPKLRCPTPESKIAHNKVYGKKELWFKHDDNAHYYPPYPDRLGACGGQEVKKKFVGVEASKRTTNWYHHEHAPDEDGYQPDQVKTHAGIMPQCIRANEKKVYGKDGLPVWYEHKWTPSEDDAKPRPRVTMQEAVVTWTKDRCGTPAEWYGHDPTVSEAEPYCPRVTTKDAEEIAIRLASESTNSVWANPSRNVTVGPAESEVYSRNVSPAVQGMLNKGSGGSMQRLIRMENTRDGPQSPQHLAIKPEAEENHRNNTVGSMKSVFNEPANRNYADEIGAGVRAIRPEAMQTFEKNKGVMADCFQGYRDQAFPKSVHKAPAQDPAIAIKHSGSSMDKIIKGTGPPGSGRGHAARAVKPEAEENARTHNGDSMKDVFFAGAAEFAPRGPKVRSDLAMEIARKDRSFVADLIR